MKNRAPFKEEYKKKLVFERLMAKTKNIKPVVSNGRVLWGTRSDSKPKTTTAK
jgi:hypothetical protein